VIPDSALGGDGCLPPHSSPQQEETFSIDARVTRQSLVTVPDAALNSGQIYRARRKPVSEQKFIDDLCG
jgi:hypothetical protein